MTDTETVKIKFSQSRTVDDHRVGTANEQRFEAGRTYEMSPRSADRWVKRGVADWASDEDRAKAAGASSDVSLNISDRDRLDPAKVQDAAATGTGTATSGEAAGAGGEAGQDYETMSKADLKSLADSRGVASASGASKAELIKALERNDVVTSAVASGDFDVLHVDELRAHAEQEQIDLTGKTSKPDIVEAIASHHKA